MLYFQHSGYGILLGRRRHCRWVCYASKGVEVEEWNVN